MRFLPATVLFALILVSPVTSQEQQRPLEVQESFSRPVQFDGIFEPAEWEDATRVLDANPCEIYTKRHGGHLFLGARCAGLSLPVLDLFLNPDGAKTYQLHASSYLAERVLEDDETVESFWRPGLDLHWTANTVSWDTAVADSLSEAGILGQEMLRQAVIPYDGFEVRIREDQFSSPYWRLRVEVSQFAGDDAPIVFPHATPGTELRDIWFTVHLAPATVSAGVIR